MELRQSLYGIEYQHEGRGWIVDIHANSFKDAEQKMRAIGYGSVIGEVQGQVPVGLGWWVRLICWWKNR